MRIRGKHEARLVNTDIVNFFKEEHNKNWVGTDSHQVQTEVVDKMNKIALRNTEFKGEVYEIRNVRSDLKYLHIRC